ncbi:DNA-directed RNA polymerase subunit A'' [uncultured archaeon]|nr:DNA-directed RNA polymerase subunit A'' [uncultured archaeon]
MDARKEPKKPIMDIFLKGDAETNEEKAKQIAKEIECTTLDKVAYVEEDFEEKKILITMEPAELESEGVVPSEVAKKVKALAGSHVEHKENVITVKPTASSLRNIRRLTNKLRHVHIKGVERINRTLVVKGKDGKYFIRTSGSNLAVLMKNPKVDTERLYTNDVQETNRVLGIEAARNALVREIKQVLDMQNLNVDVRHCMLLADAMTMDGEIKSIGRHGLSGEKAGVLARAAFEETVKHLINAATHGEDDKLIGVTENIIIGQTVPVGTGLVRLKVKLG